MADTHTRSSPSSVIRSVLFGILTGGIVCILLLSLAAVLMTAVDVPNVLIAPIGVVSACVGGLFGGIVAAVLLKKRGWMAGLLTGAGLFLLILIGGWFLAEGASAASLLLKGALILLCATVGGMLGVNLVKRR